MSNELIGWLVFSGIIVLLIGGTIYAIVDKSRTKRSGSYASMAAFHDMQASDKQRAIETIIEMRSDKKWEAEESGERKQDELQ